MSEPQELIEKIKERATTYAKKHAADNAKNFYILGKRDAAATILAMIRADGVVAAITDVAKELVKHDPDHPHAKWILENEEWKKP